MEALKQTGVVTMIFIRTIPQRLGSSLSAVAGIAGVVAVMVTVLSIASGFRATLESTASPDTAIVLRGGNDSELSSTLTLETARIVSDAPRILRDADGAQASAELLVIVDLPKRSTGTDANVPLRGVQTAAFAIRDRVRIVEGRRFEPGRNELIVGAGAAREFGDLALGSRHRWGDTEWTVVGIFEADGSLSESELWCDAKVLQPAYRRGNTFQSVYVRLDSADGFDEFKDALTADPRVNVRAVRESEYYAAQSRSLSLLITVLGAIVTGLMGFGAILGAVLTLYSSVVARTREIATLRALGFGSTPVVLAVLLESQVLSLAGGLVGGTLAYVGFNGYQAATLNLQSFTQVVFAFRVTPALLALGLALSLVVGLLAGLIPALRAAWLPVTTALREL